MSNNETFTYGIQITSDSSGAIKDFKAGGNSAEKFAKSLGELDKKSGKAGRTFKKTGKDVGSLQRGFREAAASAALLEGPLGGVAGRLSAVSAVAGRGNLALAGIGLGFAASAFLAKKAIGAYAETENQLSRLNAQLELTGYVSGFTTDQLDLMARSIARNTLASTADMRQAISVMLTFTNITGDVFEGAIRASNNLAQVMGGTAASAAVQLGKALEDPRVGLTALRRSGVSFTTEQRALIISLADSGRKSEAMAEALNVLNSQLPDAAKGVGELKGAFDSLGQSYDEMLESIGQSDFLRYWVTNMTGVAAATFDLAKNTLDPSIDIQINDLLQERLVLVERLAKEGKRQGVAGANYQLTLVDSKIKALQGLRGKEIGKDDEKLAKGEAVRQQRELDQRNRILVTQGIKEGVIRSRTATVAGSFAAKIETQILNQQLANNLISIEKHNAKVTQLKLNQNQLEINALKDMRQQLDNDEALPLVKFRADENIRRKELERLHIEQQGVVDLASARAKAAKERQKQQAQVATKERSALKALQQAEIELLKASGGHAEAAEKQIAARYQDMLNSLTGQSQITGREIVGKLIDKEKLKISLNAMKQQVGNALDAMANRENSIDISVNTGVLTELEGRKQVLAIHKETAVALEQVIINMEAVAKSSKDKGAINGVNGLKNKIEELRSESSLLETHLNSSLGSAFSAVFSGIGKDINSAEDALKAFTLSMLDSIAQIIAKEAAAQATKAVVSGIGSLISSYHTGGDNLTGREGRKMAVSPAIFTTAPRFHNGLKSDEFPAILQTGEDVVSRNDPRNSRNGGGSGGSVIQVSAPVTIEGGGDQQRAKAIGKLVETSITRALVKEKRAGGLLSQ